VGQLFSPAPPSCATAVLYVIISHSVLVVLQCYIVLVLKMMTNLRKQHHLDFFVYAIHVDMVICIGCESDR
jgi:hypothetical protein